MLFSSPQYVLSFSWTLYIHLLTAVLPFKGKYEVRCAKSAQYFVMILYWVQEQYKYMLCILVLLCNKSYLFIGPASCKMILRSLD